MNELIHRSEALPLPLPRVAVNVRPATMDDLPFIDALQKKHTKMVGFMQTKALEGKIKLGHVLVAEEGARGEGQGASEMQSPLPVASDSSLAPRPSPLAPVPVGYLIGTDQYFKHDDIGIIYQINIAESHRRSLVAATLLKAQFERSAYGCKLYCCWCAQDIEANRFWESMGFVPLAFRAGGRKRVASSSLAPCPSPLAPASARVHIFWQRRIREGDETTPYWFPSQTTGGSIREDRLVLPIPPGMRWFDEMPRVLPREDAGHPKLENRNTKQITNQKSKIQNKAKPGTSPYAISRSRLHFVAPEAVKEKPVRAKREKKKNDPRLIAAARELRDRWLEKVNEMPLLGRGKYAVTRALPDGQTPAPATIGSADPCALRIAMAA